QLLRRVREGKGRAHGTRESLPTHSSLANLLLDFRRLSCARSRRRRVFSPWKKRRSDTSPRSSLVRNKKTAHCWLALCGASGLGGNIDNTYCFALLLWINRVGMERTVDSGSK
uniref:Uncharacterized protein n=1 Tax=Gasterosteus aculeatus TaxID=69293 RepID=G3Q567_GASAC